MPSRSPTTGSGWGGRRPGAGRKRTTEEPLFAREVRLTMPQIAFVARYGRGNFAAGPRRLIDESLARDQIVSPTNASSPAHAASSAAAAAAASHR